MKILVSQKSAAHESRNAGFALVIVLSVLVLVVALAIAFLNRATTERSAAAGYSSLISARQLSESAVGLVQSQINLATLQGQDVAWASQPGMIRTYTNSGSLKEAFKLYSAPAMIGTSIDPAAEVAKISQWKTDTARWTDLNAPVVVPVDGVDTKAYPILDPAAIDTQTAPGVASEGSIDQFTINGAPMADADQQAPMPVEWLYVLEDGSFQAATGSGTTAIVPTAGDANPIVGRIAFWTDDETAKVNINTASEGAYWDTPRLHSQYERNLAAYQPARNEFQRYPGHPAMTSLSAGLPVKSPALSFDNIYQLTPRVQAGGSNVQSADGSRTSAARDFRAVTSSLPLDGDRLYASIDELLFDKNRTSQNLTKADLESAKFFTTATSRAPEVNLFNLPRVAMWPLHEIDNASYRNATDRLLAFVSSLNGEPYFFQRKDRRSRTKDYQEIRRNRELYAYLQGLSGRSIPGFGGSFSGKYLADRDQILTEMFDYIRMTNLRDTSVNNPYGGSRSRMGSAYTQPGNGQVAPIKIDVGGVETKGLGRFPVITEASIVFVGVGGKTRDGDDNIVTTPVDEKQLQPPVPLTSYTRTQPDDSTQVQAIFIFQFFVPAMGWSDYNPDFTVQVDGLNQFQLAGTGDSPENMLFPASGSVWVSNANMTHSRLVGGVVDWRSMVADRTYAFGDSSSKVKVLSREEGNESRFPFFSKIIDVSNEVVGGVRPTMDFEGGQITVKIFAGEGEGPGRTDDSLLVQTITMDIPNGTFPLPDISRPNARLIGAPGPQRIDTNQLGFRVDQSQVLDRFDTINLLMWQAAPTAPSALYSDRGNNLQITREDIVRSVVLRDGDPRMVQAAVVEADAYVAHPNWNDTDPVTGHFAHGLQTALSYNKFNGSRSGNLVEDLIDYDSPALEGTGDSPTVLDQSTPMVSANVNGAFIGGGDSGIPGDWDTGLGFYPDGGYINKPDEGNVYAGSGTAVPYFDNSQEFQSVSQTFFTPNRQIPSAGMFGSLPTGVNSGRAWQTLLFHPAPMSPTASSQHPGAKGWRVEEDGTIAVDSSAPADHLWMDLFWMPVVEPYPISEPMSTAGKVNMNYQIMPFTYINRDTGMRAVLKSEQIMALNDEDMRNGYKAVNASNMLPRNPRESLNLSPVNGTLRQFKNRFDAGNIFRSATEICDIFLVPKNESWSTDDQGRLFWSNHLLTGDNLRERPYANIYPRLTTKSNTYTVHYKVQALKNPGDEPSSVG